MRLAFLGTPDAAVPSLRALVAAGHLVELVITRPDRRRGRGGDLTGSPVKLAAQALGLRVGYHVDELAGLALDRGVVVAYGALIPAPVLDALPMLNVHFSLLPRWRGAAPVDWAILAGDEETGVSVMSLDAGLDTGPVHLERRVRVGDKTSSALTGELARMGAAALVEVLESVPLLTGATPQRGPATYARKLTKESFHVAPAMSREEVLRTVRLERAFTLVAERRLRVLRAHAASASSPPGSLFVEEGVPHLMARDGAIALDDVQPEGARAMAARDWWAGARLDAARVAWS